MTPDPRCQCVQERGIENHRAGLSDIWNSPEWIQESEAYKARHMPVCSRCGRVGPIVPGHCDEDYKDMATYIQKVRDNEVVPLCPECNRMESKGRHPCPSCIMKHRENPDHHIRYIGRDAEVCPDCRSPEEKEESAQKTGTFRRFLRKLRDKDNARRREAYRSRKEAAVKA